MSTLEAAIYNEARLAKLAAQATGGWARAIFSSVTLPAFTQSGTIVLSMVGAGGGGGSGTTTGSSLGGNSAPWGRKKIVVAVGDVLEFVIGAGGARAAANGSAGSQGGTSLVKLNGVTILTVQGGEGGLFATGTALASPAAAAATVTGADFWVPGIQAGSCQVSSSSGATGGAAVDILQTGLGRSQSISGAAAASQGGSIGTNSGGIPQPWIALLEWGIFVNDGATASATVGSPGRGGDQPGAIKAGMFAGGGSVNTAYTPGGTGGGGGGAATATQAGAGGNAYAYMVFTPSA